MFNVEDGDSLEEMVRAILGGKADFVGYFLNCRFTL